ncbi:MAG TPA: alanine racemase [Candidatus Limnocylindrales bacterium]|jgi:D-serine deaminase-like pyridoxal phosphate-dependent protein
MTVAAPVPAPAPAPLPALPAGLDTPALVVFVDRLWANITRLQADLDARGVSLRPHVKTHKSVRIARMQLDAGALGLTVGTLGEAEVMASAGLRDLFLAYPLWAEGAKAQRLRALHDTADLRIGVESVPAAHRLAAAVAGSRRPLHVAIEVDSGLHRTGVATPDEAVTVARAAAVAGLVVDGVFTHGGHSYRPGAAGAVALDEVSALEQAAGALEAAGFEVTLVSAGATPTRTLSAAGRVTEIRAGTYALGDRQQVALGAMAPDQPAAVVASTVVAAKVGRAVLDAGAKALTKDLPAFLEGYGALPAWPGAVIDRLNDYHGLVSLPAGGAQPRIGDVVGIVPNHVCPVVDLVSSFVALGDDGRVDHWAVDARGRSG